MITCTIGVMAYNEEHNIVQILHALLNQEIDQRSVCEIIVVASGCTDRTVELASEVARTHSIVRVEAQSERAGKAVAINQLIELARGDVIVLAGADTLPDPSALKHLLAPFEDSSVGMTGARVVPLNDPRTFMGFTVQILWNLHHQMALRWPKLGELVAFRNVVPALPANSATDEVALEAQINGRGYRLVYAPDAVVYNRGPETLNDFLIQRRRIFAGHLHIAAIYHYHAASMPLRNLVALACISICYYPRALFWTIGAALLECFARLLGQLDFTLGHSHHIWRPVHSTKKIQAQTLVLVALQCCEGCIPRHAIRRRQRARNMSASLFWWDYHRNQGLLMLPLDHALNTTPEEWVQAFTQEMHQQGAVTEDLILSYRVVEFAPLLALEANNNSAPLTLQPSHA